MLGPMIRDQGMAVGSRAGFDAMNRAMVAGGIHPVDSTFALVDAAQAFLHLQSGAHLERLRFTIEPPPRKRGAA
jgi:hypothetical protein